MALRKFQNRLGYLCMAGFLSLSYSLILTGQERSGTRCDAPEYFGLCDPFVPGVIMDREDNETVRVIDTWSHGPAVMAGICGGDKIISINSVSASKSPLSRLIREIIAESPGPVTLRIKRGQQELEFSVPRIRESALASLSRQKFLEGKLVPLAQTSQGLKELNSFRNRVLASHGVKEIDDFLFPLGMPEKQTQEFLNRVAEASKSGRDNQIVTFTQDPKAYTPGFSAALMKTPEEVWIYQVIPNSPAYRGGVFPGDQLLQVDGQNVSGLTQQELTSLLLRKDKSSQIGIRVRRGQSVLNFKLITQKREDFDQGPLFEEIPFLDRVTGNDYVVGISALCSSHPLTAICESVEYPSPAFDAGLLVGDLLLQVNHVPVGQLKRAELQAFLAPSRVEKTTFDMLRGSKKLSFEISPMRRAILMGTIGRKPSSLVRFGFVPEHCPE